MMIASGSHDTTIKLWNREGKLLRVSFSPNGEMIASGSDDNIVILWNLDLDDLLVKGSDWLHDYLKNPDNGMSKDDPRRHLCDGINSVAD
ncbi:MAG TPA: hypothetical protein DCE56_13055 [Cyanobacteria bacterium UBA8553]|nr:hypothetical protein [Cyanobacteria bacterium UBA8553]HAJ60918.1 hypothetical protein [Cyanobacteria bacterium UBA8543]